MPECCPKTHMALHDCICHIVHQSDMRSSRATPSTWNTQVLNKADSSCFPILVLCEFSGMQQITRCKLSLKLSGCYTHMISCAQCLLSNFCKEWKHVINQSWGNDPFPAILNHVFKIWVLLQLGNIEVAMLIFSPHQVMF